MNAPDLSISLIMAFYIYWVECWSNSIRQYLPGRHFCGGQFSWHGLISSLTFFYSVIIQWKHQPLHQEEETSNLIQILSLHLSKFNFIVLRIIFTIEPTLKTRILRKIWHDDLNQTKKVKIHFLRYFDTSYLYQICHLIYFDIELRWYDIFMLSSQKEFL